AHEAFFLPEDEAEMHPKHVRFDDPNCKHLDDKHCGPVLAAHMWKKVHHACPECVIVAGDFSSGGGDGGSPPYLEPYAAALKDAGFHPPTWGLHPYTDASNEEWCRKRNHADYDPTADWRRSHTLLFLDGLYKQGYDGKTSVWLDEVSVFGADKYAH